MDTVKEVYETVVDSVKKVNENTQHPDTNPNNWIIA